MDPKATTNNHIPKREFETFGNYLLLKRLAMGGMAEVFLARPASQMGNGRLQVVKRILPHVATDTSFLRMFQTEIQVLMGFNHPHTVQLHDFGQVQGQPYIAMEYIEGKNIKDIITKFAEQGKMIPIPMVLSLLAQAAAGLHYAHHFVNKVTGKEVHAIHRDISPHNLLVSYDGNLKVIDFGIAKAASGIQEATRTGTIKGKYAYLSPEQATGQPLDGRSDIFALGIVAWELLTLRRPFYRDGDSELTILASINTCDQHLKAPSNYNCEIPKEVDEVIIKMMKRNPSERFATARDLQIALRRVMQQHYPDYSYGETAKTMLELFSEEMGREEEEIRVLNMDAQDILVHSAENATTVIDGSKEPGVVTGVMVGIKALAPAAATDGVESRLRAIEGMMKKKATNRHYLMFAIYIISIIIIKLDEAVPLFNFLLPQDKTTVVAMNDTPPPPQTLHSQKRAPARAVSRPVPARNNYNNYKNTKQNRR